MCGECRLKEKKEKTATQGLGSAPTLAAKRPGTRGSTSGAGTRKEPAAKRAKQDQLEEREDRQAPPPFSEPHPLHASGLFPNYLAAGTHGASEQEHARAEANFTPSAELQERLKSKIEEMKAAAAATNLRLQEKAQEEMRLKEQIEVARVAIGLSQQKAAQQQQQDPLLSAERHQTAGERHCQAGELQQGPNNGNTQQGRCGPSVSQR